MKQNKGFSLIELIIVIAIMAILVGIMAPQLIKYIEKTNVSADTKICDTIHSAIVIAMSDPKVVTDEKSQEMLFGTGGLMDPAGGGCRLDHFGAGSDWVNCPFAKDVEETTGMSLFAMGSDHSQYLKSKGAKDNGIICIVPNSNGTDCAVYIAWSDREAKGNAVNYTGSYDGLEDATVIYAK